ncbi:unnamed protein product [Paramecium primaurelia]|uniref:Uncharacterized protein n=1 Tax=Paramecium primaurelia TaxID=5886 RepID=A0A8S1L4N1_PARPR|nr:unnamed protein product [Paramecium primaurelia]
MSFYLQTISSEKKKLSRFQKSIHHQLLKAKNSIIYLKNQKEVVLGEFLGIVQYSEDQLENKIQINYFFLFDIKIFRNSFNCFQKINQNNRQLLEQLARQLIN